MERLRSTPSTATSEDVPSLPSSLEVPDVRRQAVPLLERLSALRSEDVPPDEVASFLDGLSLPLGPGESPRSRADLLLEVLEDERLCTLTTPDGRQVGGAALEALQELGFPFALEVTPAMLARVREHQASDRPMNGLLGGLGSAVGSAALVWAVYLANVPTEYKAWLSVLLLGPVAVSVLAKWMELPSLHRLANLAQWLVGLACLLASANTEKVSTTLTLGIAGVLALLSAFFLRHGPPKELPSKEPPPKEPES
ncbi:hypothetical protein D187_002800 [Cystobacter fuscus DSM 2262]|uniref:Uncharacterized protein n=1 Tax=Cystobacter fuscus (strain ATCC 25194 / DSM 2262 / NBRC 100088 / M29) TaxID=1242864 RepID=S9QEA8_CYSF2|nr:hypothetical protein [Cystobacter fuscus]EPX59639.1 hypothetical protein D187_002800 [Cystobacter fuscus DSM 2262]